MWRYSLKSRPYMGLVYGRYLQFSYLKWLFGFSDFFCLNPKMGGENHYLHSILNPSLKPIPAQYLYHGHSVGCQLARACAPRVAFNVIFSWTIWPCLKTLMAWRSAWTTTRKMRIQPIKIGIYCKTFKTIQNNWIEPAKERINRNHQKI